MLAPQVLPIAPPLSLPPSLSWSVQDETHAATTTCALGEAIRQHTACRIYWVSLDPARWLQSTPRFLAVAESWMRSTVSPWYQVSQVELDCAPATENVPDPGVRHANCAADESAPTNRWRIKVQASSILPSIRCSRPGCTPAGGAAAPQACAKPSGDEGARQAYRQTIDKDQEQLGARAWSDVLYE